MLNPSSIGEPSIRSALTASLFGMLAGAMLVWIIALVGRAFFKRESVGGGDLKLVAMIGAFLGAGNAVASFFLASVLALPFALYGKISGRWKVILFAPFLAAAAIYFSFWPICW